VVQTDPDGLLVIDTSVPAMADKVLAAIKTISPLPIRQIINTSSEEHHTAGNDALSKAGRNIYAAVGGGGGREPSRLQGAPIIATERAMHRMAGLLDEPARQNVMWPDNTFAGARKDWSWGGEPIEILYKPAAHTDGDLIVWFRKSDVIATGDILDTVKYPTIDLKRGGTVEGYLNALNDILDIMIPLQNNQGGTLAVPGHGRICNEGDVAEIRDTMTIITDRIREMVKKKMTLAQVKQAKPTLDYDGVFGDPNAFIETVFTDLSRPASSGSSRPASK
jgi:glyoxylase-like metal-dependent hydrolase (beta-lactamase superfamily II)